MVQIMTTAIILIFVAGYLLVALESVIHISKTAVALLMAVFCWALLYLGAGASGVHASAFTRALGENSEILFFLMGAMVIVEVVDANGGFDFVRQRLLSRTKRSLLWKLTLTTFFLSAVLDNMTTAIVMVMLLNKIVSDPRDKLLYSCMVILAANSGGAFSPIGDVTTIMLWVKGNISTLGVVKSLFIPSLVSVLMPGLILSINMKGMVSGSSGRDFGDGREAGDMEPTGACGCTEPTMREKLTVFVFGVGGLLFVPVFRFMTGLPPFMGTLLVLSLLWIVTEFLLRDRHASGVSCMLHKIDLSTILFFLGILTAVAALAETGVLRNLGIFLDEASGGNPYIVTTVIGFFSAVVDNVPLVASCMGMYDTAFYATDSTFWLLLAYCAGIGGSMLIIGSAAGVVVMGLQKISFGWYLRHFSWIALVGYLSGILAFFLLELL